MPCPRAVRNHEHMNIPKAQHTAPSTEEGLLFARNKSSHRDRLVCPFHHVGEEQKPKDFRDILLGDSGLSSQILWGKSQETL